MNETKHSLLVHAWREQRNIFKI